MYCNYSACPARLLLCLVRRFINRTNRGRPDGCYGTVISFHGSLSSSWALVCCLLAACWSFPCNTHSCKGEVLLTWRTDGIYASSQLLTAGTTPFPNQSARGRSIVCFSVRSCTHTHTHTFEHAGSALVFVVLHYRLGCQFLCWMSKTSGQMLLIYSPAGDSGDLWWKWLEGIGIRC